MEPETITEMTIPNNDETESDTESESMEFEKNQERYQALISTFPHIKGWRPKDPLIEYGGYWWVQLLLEGCLHAQEFFKARPTDFLVCSYPKTGYWKAHQENPDRILFLKYETMRADTLPYVKILANFMGYGFTTEEEEKGIVEKVMNLCSFETLKNLEANKGEKEREDRPAVYANSAYFRKGKVGDWTNYLTPEMAARIDGLMEEKFKGTGLLEDGK